MTAVCLSFNVFKVHTGSYPAGAPDMQVRAVTGATAPLGVAEGASASRWALTWELVQLGVIPVVPGGGGHPSRSPVTPDGGQASLSGASSLSRCPLGPQREGLWQEVQVPPQRLSAWRPDPGPRSLGKVRAGAGPRLKGVSSSPRAAPLIGKGLCVWPLVGKCH